MALFPENLYPWIEPLVSVVFVIGDARAEDIDESKAFVLDGAFDDFDHVLLFAAERARHICRAADHRQWNGIDRVFNAAVRRGLGLHALGARGRDLPGREAINLV